jgi:DNA-directed RNA polymerase subunit K/omega
MEEKKKTKPYMSEYEFCALASARAAQLSSRMEGVKPMVTIASTDPLQIAIKEIREKKVNLVVRRNLPDGTKEDHYLKDMILPKI